MSGVIPVILIKNVPDTLPFVNFLPGGHSLEWNDFMGRIHWVLNLLLIVEVRHAEAMFLLLGSYVYR